MSAAITSAGNRRESAAYRAILMHPVRRVRAQGSAWLHVMLAGLVLVAGVAAMMVKEKGALVLAVGAGIPLTLLLVMWWVMLFASILDQCSAAAVHLVPRMRERALRVTVAGWGAAVVLMTLCVGVPIGYPGQVAVVTGLALLEMTVMFSRWRIGLFTVILLVRFYAGIPIPDWLGAFLASNGAVAVGLLLVALDLRAALHRMFGTPASLRAWNVSSPDTVPPVITSLVRLLRGLRRDDARRQPLFTRLLGAPAYVGTVRLLLVPAVLCVAIRVLVMVQDTGTAHRRLFATRCMALIGVLVLQGMMAHLVAAGMVQRKNEQGLVRLSPAAPLAADMNRVLARYLLENFAVMWLGCSALAVGAMLVLGANAGETWRVAAVCCFSLALAGLPLRDYARARRAQAIPTILYYLCAAAALVAAYQAVSGKFAAQTWAAMALAGVMLAVIFVGLRWRAMVTAAPAFPAGRKR